MPDCVAREEFESRFVHVMSFFTGRPHEDSVLCWCDPQTMPGNWRMLVHRDKTEPA